MQRIFMPTSISHISFKVIRAQRKPPGDLDPAPSDRSGDADPLGRNDPRIEEAGLEVGALIAR
jgi:hypothetical protein